MEENNVNAPKKATNGFIPTREDFAGKKFAGGIFLLAAAVGIAVQYHPVLRSALIIEWYLIFCLVTTSIFWIGMKIIRFVLAILAIAVLGIIFDITVGNFPL